MLPFPPSAFPEGHKVIHIPEPTVTPAAIAGDMRSVRCVPCSRSLRSHLIQQISGSGGFVNA